MWTLLGRALRCPVTRIIPPDAQAELLAATEAGRRLANDRPRRVATIPLVPSVDCSGRKLNSL